MDKGDNQDRGADSGGGHMSLRDALAGRRSVRSFRLKELYDHELMQILWAGQGKTSDRGYRTAPSAGATFPLELHAITPRGVYRYDPGGHRVEMLSGEDRRASLARAALDQSFVGAAAADFVIAGVISRTSWRYGARAGRYVAIEAGAAAQGMMLMATALDLGSVIIGAYDDDRVIDLAMLPVESLPLSIIAVGHPR